MTGQDHSSPREGSVEHARSLRLAGKLGEASVVLNTLLQANPFASAVLLELGLVARDAKDYALAESTLRMVRTLDPSNAGVLHEEAFCALQQGALERATSCLQQGVAAQPTELAQRLTLGQVLCALGSPEGMQELRRVSEFAGPAPADVLERRALLRIAFGDVDGWREFSECWRGRIAPALGSRPWWSGAATADTVCVIAYAGLGDTVLFLRYLPLLQQRVRHVIAWVPAPLQRLVCQTPGVTLLTGDINDLPDDVMLCGLWELPYLVGPPEALSE